MPTTMLPGNQHHVKDLQAHWNARKRLGGTFQHVMALSLLATPFCFAFSDSNIPPPFVRPLLLGLGIAMVCLAVGSGSAYGYIWNLNRRDFNAILKSDSVAMVPILAEYHAYFSTGQNDPRLHRVDHIYKELTADIRARTIELLRSGWEASQLEFSSGVLIALINMMAYLKDAEDRHLILDVIASVGAPDCFAQLDIIAGEICLQTLPYDTQAQQHLLADVADCKAAVRVRYGKVKEAQSLLRASDAPDTFLRSAYPRTERTDGEDLLRASAEVAHALENEYNSSTAGPHDSAEQTATQNAAVH